MTIDIQRSKEPGGGSTLRKYLLTGGLSNHLEHLMKAHPERSDAIRKQFLEQVGNAIVLLKRMNGSDRLKNLYDFCDEAVKVTLEKFKEKDRVPACGKGCSACCHVQVFVHKAEVPHLVEQAQTVGIDLERLKLQNEKDYTEFEYFALPKENNACVFLGADGSCRIYEQRPLACRKHFVSSDPVNCGETDGRISVMPIDAIEIMASGLITMEGERKRAFLHEEIYTEFRKKDLIK